MDPRSEPTQVDLLVVGVNYKCEAETRSFVQSFPESETRIALAIANNSPSVSSGELATTARDHSRVIEYQEYEDNPGYFGAAHRLIVAMAESVVVRQAVIITNVDLEFDIQLMLDYIDKHSERDPSTRWILSPDIREKGLRSHRNPHGLDPSIPPSKHLTRFVFRSDSSYRIMHAAHLLRLRFVANAEEVLRRAGTDIPSTYGAMFILGMGFFRAGGFVPEASLFGEEYAIAFQALDLSVPIRFDPSFVVNHSKSSSTGLLRAGQRRAMAMASWEMYEKWKPEDDYGSMGWLVAENSETDS